LNPSPKEEGAVIQCPRCQHDMSRVSAQSEWWFCDHCGRVYTEKSF